MVIYAGSSSYRPQWLFNFWPHVTTTTFDANDKIFPKCAFLGETSSYGTHCHEFGHMLGLADYYLRDMDDPNQPQLPTNPVGNWELMGTGSHIPSHLSLYSRLFLGWLSSEEVYTIKQGEITNFNLVPLEQPYSDSTNGYFLGARYFAPDGLQYLLEYRADIGTDSELVDHGILVSRFDSSKGQYEGPLWYLGGDDYYSYWLGDPELQDADYENDERFFYWLTESTTLGVGVLEEHPAVGLIPESLEIIVDTYHDLGDEWNIESNIAAKETAYWNCLGQEVGDLLYFRWDTPSENSGSDFSLQYKQGSTWVTLSSKTNLYQDAFKYRVESAGDYRFAITNDNSLYSMNVYYFLDTYSAPEYAISWDIPETAYQIGSTAIFDIEIEISNLNKGWIPYDLSTTGTLELSLPSSYEIISSQGSYLDDPSSPIFYNHPKFITYRIQTTSLGEAPIELSYTDIGIDTILQNDITILEDLTAPYLELIDPQPGTKLTVYPLSWQVSENETGIDRYEFYLNGSLAAVKTDQGTNFEVPVPQVEGFYNLTVIVYDKVNNSMAVSQWISVDFTEPELTLFEQYYDEGVFHFLFLLNEEFSLPVHFQITVNYLVCFERIYESQDLGTNISINLTLDELNALGLVHPTELTFRLMAMDNLENKVTKLFSLPPEVPFFAEEPQDNDEGLLSFLLAPTLFAEEFRVYYSPDPIEDLLGNVTYLTTFNSYNFSMQFPDSGKYYIAVQARNSLGRELSTSVRVEIVQPEEEMSPRISGYQGFVIVLIGSLVVVYGRCGRYRRYDRKTN